MDFYTITVQQNTTKKDKVTTVVSADFRVCKSKDLMIRGGDFYAIWDQEAGLWSTDAYDVQRIIDKDLAAKREELKNDSFYANSNVFVKTMGSFSSNAWKEFQSYVSNLADNSRQLDEKLTFSNTKVTKKDYVSHRLPYALEEGSYDAFEEIISTLYNPEERAKIEWAIGSIVSGDSKDIQKFMVFYGEAGAGKSTIMNIIQKLFEGYYITFDAKALTSSGNSFATEVFKGNPLVAIQHDGDLSRIEDNTKLNSIVSHEMMPMNEKYKSAYMAKTNCFLFMGTNRPVKITDAKSGVIRRLIDVEPSGRKIPPKRYYALMSQIDFELGAIAQHCLDVYQSMGKNYYQTYRPVNMILQTDFFFNFVEDKYEEFKSASGVSAKAAYAMYKEYCGENGMEVKMPSHRFREELKNYFEKFEAIARVDGKQVRSYYTGFKADKFQMRPETVPEEKPCTMVLDSTTSLLDEELADCAAQYASTGKNEAPLKVWSEVTTTLSDLKTSRVHYVKPPLNHIVIDFDLKDDKGEKSIELNLDAASKWPPTYAEFSKGGRGIHLHYIYDGDPLQLGRIYAPDIEVKVFNGNASLRRKLSKCNSVPIAHISSGLPLKGPKVINFEGVKDEKHVRNLLLRALDREVHVNTKPACDFMYEVLEQAYAAGFPYDVSDMENEIFAFANSSHHQSDYCMKLVCRMHFKSKDSPETTPRKEVYENDKLVFFDCEVFPNLFVVVWKYEGSDECVTMVNPTPIEIEQLMKMKLVGFNCKGYDNHILYARMLNYDNHKLFYLSQKIINNERDAKFPEANNISYTDILDFSSEKQSLKKFEIALGIHHQENAIPWDQDVPESRWDEVVEYCKNDVIATEAVFHARKSDWDGRKILAAVSGGKVNDSTNQLTTKLILHNDPTPQSQFHYRDLSKPIMKLDSDMEEFLRAEFPEMMAKPFGEAKSILPYFPGYSFDKTRTDKSIYRGHVVGEGGFVWAKPGIYSHVVVFDVASMHPHSVTSEYLFGVYTKGFFDLMEARVAIKHGDYEKAKTMFDGRLAPFLDDEDNSAQLSGALKIAINSVYGLTAAKFDNKFRDKRNEDNIVAKRGALFMIDLMHAVTNRGGEVIHIKTDSIKVVNPSPEMVDFIMTFGKRYGYTFEVEHIFERICLVNDAVYIGLLSKKDEGWVKACKKAASKGLPEPTRWNATGAQFAVPYVFKTLFSKERIEFDDLCETKSVKTSLHLDMNENLSDVTAEEALYEKKVKAIKKAITAQTGLKKVTSEELSEYLSEHPDEAQDLANIQKTIKSGHNYVFVGRVGRFTPMLPGANGGILVREQDGQFNSATGAKGYRWMESEMVKSLGLESMIDENYYKELANKAIETISEFGDFEYFVSDDETPVPEFAPFITKVRVPKEIRDVPPWLMPCGDYKYEVCYDCEKYANGECSLGYNITNMFIDEGDN